MEEVNSVDNVQGSVKVSRSGTAFLLALLSIVITASLFILSLYLYPSFYESVGLIERKEVGSDVNKGPEDEEVESVKLVDYTNDKLGISFKLSPEYVVEEEQQSADPSTNMPELYSVVVKGLIPDSKGNLSSKFSSFLEIHMNDFVKFSYDGEPTTLAEGDLSTVFVGEKSYPIKKYAIGEGNESGSFFVMDYMIDLDSKVYVHILDRTSITNRYCSELPKEECFGVESSLRTTEKQKSDALEILKTLKFTK